MKTQDVTTWTDKQILEHINPKINNGGILFSAVQESQKRRLKKYVNRTIHSNDFDAKGNFIG